MMGERTHRKHAEGVMKKTTQKIKRRYLTLIEMLIVIALIGIVASALAVNLGGGLRKGQEFKTQQGKKKIKNMLYYEITQNMLDPKEAVDQWQEIVENSSLRDRDVAIEEMIQDGWGEEYEVVYDEEHDDIVIYSSRDEKN